MADSLLLHALLAGIGIVLMTAPLGCFVVWQRLAYFGDTLAHAALLGVALALLLHLPISLGILLIAFTLALALTFLHHPRLAEDTQLGILAHTTLAAGLIAVTMLKNQQVDLMGYLFGDILLATRNDILWIYAVGIGVFAILYRLWRPLLLLTVHRELAQAEGIPVRRLRMLYMLLLAGVIALTIQLVGLLLTTALLILPPAAARYFSRSPEQMAAMAMGAGSLSVLLGLCAAFHWDLPAGPAIVMAAALLFLLARALCPRRE